MGWSDLGDGCYDGDGPADAVAAGLAAIGEESMQREGVRPSGEALLHALVEALNLDGTEEPFYEGNRRIDALVIEHGKSRMRIDGSEAEPWMVTEMSLLLDEVAEDYLESWNRPPRLREIAHYFASHLQNDEALRESTSDEVLWDLRGAKFEWSKKRKSKERCAAPEVAPPHVGGGRVRHAKFGEGVIVSEEGDRLKVRFGDDVRVVLRQFVEELP